MSLQMFMKIDGVSGESSHFQYKGWSDVLSWNWGMTSNRKTAHANGGDKTSLNELSIVKPVASDSAAIRLLFANGTNIPSVEFSITPVVGKREVQSKYLFIKMQDVVIKSIVSGGAAEDSFFKEHLTLLFGKVRFEYCQGATSDSSGVSGTQAEFNFNWDVPANTEVAS